MKTSLQTIGLLPTAVLVLIATGCSTGKPNGEPAESDATRSPTEIPLPPTATPVLTDTPVPTATAAPGSVAVVQVFGCGYKEYAEIADKDEIGWDLSGWMLSGSKGRRPLSFLRDTYWRQGTRFEYTAAKMA